MINYDFAVILYLLIMIFNFCWVGYGHTLYLNEPHDSVCFNNGLMTYLYVILIFQDVILAI